MARVLSNRLPLPSVGEWRGPNVTDYLIGAGPENFRQIDSDYIYVGEVETAVGSDIQPAFGIMGFSTSDAIGGLWFSL